MAEDPRPTVPILMDPSTSQGMEFPVSGAAYYPGRLRQSSFFDQCLEKLRLTLVEANRTPFEVLTPENRYVFVSSAKHIREVDAAPDSVLSLQAAAKQVSYRDNTRWCY